MVGAGRSPAVGKRALVVAFAAALLCGAAPAAPKKLPPYRPGTPQVNVEGYRAAKLLSVGWGKARNQVGQRLLASRGALSYTPRYIAVAPKGDIYIGDEANQRILRFDPSGKHADTFDAAYGGYYLSVDKDGNVYTLFRRMFQPFTIAVYRDGKVVREIGLSFLMRNPMGDRVWVGPNGRLGLSFVQSYRPLTKLSAPETKPCVMENLVTGEKWSYTAQCRKGTLARDKQGCPSRYFDKVYVLGADGGLSIRDHAGKTLGGFDVRGAVAKTVGAEPGADLALGRALRVFGEDPQGNVYVLARNRIRRTGKSAFGIAKFSPKGRVLFAADCYPCDIHYGSECQFFPSTLDVDTTGAVYQLCTEGKKGVRVVKWSRGQSRRQP